MKRFLLAAGLVAACVGAGWAAEGACCCGKAAACCSKSCSCGDCTCGAKCEKKDGSGRSKGHAGTTYKR